MKVVAAPRMLSRPWSRSSPAGTPQWGVPTRTMRRTSDAPCSREPDSTQVAGDEPAGTGRDDVELVDAELARLLLELGGEARRARRQVAPPVVGEQEQPPGLGLLLECLDQRLETGIGRYLAAQYALGRHRQLVGGRRVLATVEQAEPEVDEQVARRRVGRDLVGLGDETVETGYDDDRNGFAQ